MQLFCSVCVVEACVFIHHAPQLMNNLTQIDQTLDGNTPNWGVIVVLLLSVTNREKSTRS